MNFESRIEKEIGPSSEIDINPEIITRSERASVEETSWNATERQGSKMHCSEHPHKGDVRPRIRAFVPRRKNHVTQ